MKYWKAGLLFLAAFILQSGVVNFISIMGRTPNLILALVIVLSFLYENELYGFVWGAVFGVLYDICFGIVIGESAIPLVIVALIIFCLDGIYNVENYLNLSIIAAGTIVGYTFINWIMLKLANNPQTIGMAVGHMYISWIMTFVIVTLIYFILLKDVIKYRHRDRKLI